jgi:hypothetical protein
MVTGVQTCALPILNDPNLTIVPKNKAPNWFRYAKFFLLALCVLGLVISINGLLSGDSKEQTNPKVTIINSPSPYATHTLRGTPTPHPTVTQTIPVENGGYGGAGSYTIVYYNTTTTDYPTTWNWSYGDGGYGGNGGGGYVYWDAPEGVTEVNYVVVGGGGAGGYAAGGGGGSAWVNYT